MKLTTRQWDLYNYLKANTDRWITQKEICENVKGYQWHERKNDNCPMIREDKLVINNSDEVDKIIISYKYQFKIATTYDEIMDEYNIHKQRLLQQAKQLSALKHKMRKNLQGKIISNQGKEMTEDSKAKQFYEVYENVSD